MTWVLAGAALVPAVVFVLACLWLYRSLKVWLD